MSKFKSIKEYLYPKKCIALIKRMLGEPSSSTTSHEDNWQRIVKQYSNDNISESMFSACSAEGFIPLTARESELIDLSFYNPYFNNRHEDEGCEEEILPPVLDIEPMHSLIPQVVKELFNTDAALTNLLIGEKENVALIEPLQNVLPAETHPLDEQPKRISVHEMAQEEQNQSENNTVDKYQPVIESAVIHQSQRRRSVSGNEASVSSTHNDDDDQNITRRKVRLKRYKRALKDNCQQMPASPLSPGGSHVGKVESHDSLLASQEQYKVNISPQRQREKARAQMTRKEKGVIPENDSTSTGMVADDEDNVD